MVVIMQYLEVFAGAEIKEIRDKMTHELRGLKQEVYWTIPNSQYPVKALVRIDRPLQPGRYTVEFAYRVGRYGDPEINPFEAVQCSPVAKGVDAGDKRTG